MLGPSRIAAQIVTRVGFPRPAGGDPGGRPIVEVTLHVHGKTPVDVLAAGLSELPGVEAAVAGDVNAIRD